MKLSKIHDETAQGVLEFAFIVSVLMMLFVGTVDFARFLYYDTAIQNAARIGAETASNHCPFAAYNCGNTTTPTADAYVLWSTYCEASPYLSLAPSYSSCAPGTTSSWVPSCGMLGCTSCTNDICVDRTNAPQITVSVGYKFHPISFLLDWAFTEQACFAGDSAGTNHHTLCASSVGRVAS